MQYKRETAPPADMDGMKHDDSARGIPTGDKYSKDVESGNSKSDSNIPTGTIIGTHGSAAKLVTVEHNGAPSPRCPIVASKQCLRHLTRLSLVLNNVK